MRSSIAASANLSSARVGPALGDAGRSDLEDDLGGRARRRLDRAGARGVADRAEADRHLLDFLVVLDVHELGDREQHAVAQEDLAAVRVVDRRELDLLALDVLPDVHLGPVRDREHPDVLALAVAAVEEVPQLGPLVLRVPLTELVAEGVHALLGPGLVLVAAPTAEHRVEAVLLDGVEKGDALEPVPDGLGTRVLGDPAGVDRGLDGTDDQLGAELGDPAVPVVEDLAEVVAGVDVHERERDPGGPEGLLRDLQHHRGVLAAREEEHGVLELGRDLAEDVDRLGLERVEVRDRRIGHPRSLRLHQTRPTRAAILAVARHRLRHTPHRARPGGAVSSGPPR